MIKYFKMLMFMGFVVIGLYFFGDFRINDTNVRDFLRNKITINNMRMLRSQLNEFHTAFKSFTDAKSDVDRINKTIQQTMGDSVDIKNLPLDDISKKDREKLMKLLDDHLKDQPRQK